MRGIPVCSACGTPSASASALFVWNGSGLGSSVKVRGEAHVEAGPRSWLEGHPSALETRP